MSKDGSTRVTLQSSFVDAVLEGAGMGLLLGVLLLAMQPELQRLMAEQVSLVGLGSYLFAYAQVGVAISFVALLVLGIPALEITRQITRRWQRHDR